jgi:predicted transcriptional regulator YheO
MAKATIKSKTGAVITIEGTDKEVSSVLAHFETATQVATVKGKIHKEASVRKETKKRAAASDLIVELKEDGFFDKPKSLSEIAHALEERGRITPITSLSGVVIKLVQQRYLGRKKVDGKWVYGK